MVQLVDLVAVWDSLGDGPVYQLREHWGKEEKGDGYGRYCEKMVAECHLSLSLWNRSRNDNSQVCASLYNEWSEYKCEEDIFESMNLN
jgi:hypothetical protein